MTRKPKKRKLSYRARLLVKELASGKHKSITSAGKAVGYSDGVAASHALANIQGSMAEIMDQCGLTDASLIQNHLIPLLGAMRTKYFHHQGKVKDQVQEEALEIRRDALDIALRLKGKYASVAVEQTKQHTVQVLVLDAAIRPKRDIPPPTVIEIARRETLSPSAEKPITGSGSNRGEV